MPKWAPLQIFFKDLQNMYFQEHISTAACGTNKSNFSALTFFKLKIICDFSLYIAFYIFSVKMWMRFIIQYWKLINFFRQFLVSTDALLLDIWHETFVFKSLFLSKHRTIFSHLQPCFLKTIDSFFLFFVSTLPKIS